MKHEPALNQFSPLSNWREDHYKRHRYNRRWSTPEQDAPSPEAVPDAETVENFPFFDSLQGRGRGLLEDDLEYVSEISGPDRFAIPIEFSFLKWGWGGGAANVFSKLARVLLSLENAVVALNGRLEA